MGLNALAPTEFRKKINKQNSEPGNLFSTGYRVYILHVQDPR